MSYGGRLINLLLDMPMRTMDLAVAANLVLLEPPLKFEPVLEKQGALALLHIVFKGPNVLILFSAHPPNPASPALLEIALIDISILLQQFPLPFNLPPFEVSRVLPSVLQFQRSWP